MFGLSFGARRKPVEGRLVVVRLNARLQPMHRGEHFEDPLIDIVKELSLGEVTGGGTQLSGDDSGVEFCDIELVMPETNETALGSLIAALEELGAPKGSKLLVGEEGAETPFGSHEGLALSLNGTDLPDEVYRTCDINHVVAELDRLMGEKGRFMSYWEGARDSVLYCYGPSFATMRAAIEPLLAGYPLCAKARVEQIA
jgi:hypothetical protein